MESLDARLQAIQASRGPWVETYPGEEEDRNDFEEEAVYCGEEIDEERWKKVRRYKRSSRLDFVKNAVEDEKWFEVLEAVSSFAFSTRCDHHRTVRQEFRRLGVSTDRFWSCVRGNRKWSMNLDDERSPVPDGFLVSANYCAVFEVDLTHTPDRGRWFFEWDKIFYDGWFVLVGVDRSGKAFVKWSTLDVDFAFGGTPTRARGLSLPLPWGCPQMGIQFPQSVIPREERLMKNTLEYMRDVARD